MVNTHKGYVRVSNEDRVSIILNAQNKFWKMGKKQDSILSFSMFSVFDGHGGINCCNFLKEKLHNMLIKDLDLEGLLIPSIKEIYKKLDEEYLDIAIKNKHHFSGSCAITAMILNKTMVIINSGDCRALMSADGGTRVIEGSFDHKPGNITEFNRVIENGGELYRMSSNIKTGQNNFYFVSNYSKLKKINELKKTSKNMLFGPWRVKPGGLSVARSFGDLESKIPQFGGRSGPITSEPDIFEYDIEGLDFVFLACELIR